jgi:hypothetical protein
MTYSHLKNLVGKEALPIHTELQKFLALESNVI